VKANFNTKKPYRSYSVWDCFAVTMMVICLMIVANDVLVIAQKLLGKH